MSGKHGSYPETDRRLATPLNCKDHAETRQLFGSLEGTVRTMLWALGGSAMLMMTIISGISGVIAYNHMASVKNAKQVAATNVGVSTNRHSIERLDGVCVDLDGRVSVIEKR